MKRKKISENEKFQTALLDKISEGTTAEFEELCNEIYKNNRFKDWLIFGLRVPFMREIVKCGVEKSLDKIGIAVADIGVGFLGTGFFPGHNYYQDKRTRRPLMHNQVLGKIKSCAG